MALVALDHLAVPAVPRRPGCLAVLVDRNRPAAQPVRSRRSVPAARHHRARLAARSHLARLVRPGVRSRTSPRGAAWVRWRRSHLAGLAARPHLAVPELRSRQSGRRRLVALADLVDRAAPESIRR